LTHAHLGQSREEAVRAIDGLIKQGKVRYYGVSNFRGWRIAETVRIAQQLGMPTPSVLQPVYSVVNRLAEMEQLPAAQEYGLGVISYSPLARGVLTGKYRSKEDVPADPRVARAAKRLLDTQWPAET